MQHWQKQDPRPEGCTIFEAEGATVAVTPTVSQGLIAFVLVGVATWWVIAPRSYVACIRKVSWLWMSAYPFNTKEWFPLYLRVWGLVMWLAFLFGLVHYWSRFH
jgi:hypothetical protein